MFVRLLFVSIRQVYAAKAFRNAELIQLPPGFEADRLHRGDTQSDFVITSASVLSMLFALYNIVCAACVFWLFVCLCACICACAC